MSQFEKLSTFIEDKNKNFKDMVSYYKFVWLDENISNEEN